MHTEETYRLNAPILAIHSANESSAHRTPIMVPAGATVTVTNGPLDGLRMVDVLWDDKTVMMFTADLRARGKLIRSSTNTKIA